MGVSNGYVGARKSVPIGADIRPVPAAPPGHRLILQVFDLADGRAEMPEGERPGPFGALDPRGEEVKPAGIDNSRPQPIPAVPVRRGEEGAGAAGNRFRPSLECDIIAPMEEGTIVGRDLFWDTDSDRIDLQKNKEYIIERVVELGDDKAVRWLFANYPRSEIKKVLARSRRISRKSSHYWSLILKP